MGIYKKFNTYAVHTIIDQLAIRMGNQYVYVAYHVIILLWHVCYICADMIDRIQIYVVLYIIHWALNGSVKWEFLCFNV